MRAAAKLVIRELERILAEPGPALTYVDYGSGPSGSGMELYRSIVQTVSQCSPDRALTIVHQDLATNPWADFFERLENDPQTYLRLPQNPAVMVALGSFYERRLPPASVHVGTSFMAAHWMSREEVVGVPSSAALLDASGAIATRIAADAAADWRDFWTARQTELAPGGAMIVRCIGAEENAAHSTSLEILRMLGCALQQVADSGVITRSVADNFVLSEYPRTVVQARAPFNDGSLAELSLESVDLAAEHDPIREQYDQDGDAQRYGKRMTDFLRAFTETSLRAYLLRCAQMSRIDTDRAVAQVYDRCEQRWTDDPDAHPFRAWTLTVAARRKP